MRTLEYGCLPPGPATLYLFAPAVSALHVHTSTHPLGLPSSRPRAVPLFLFAQNGKDAKAALWGRGWGSENRELCD